MYSMSRRKDCIAMHVEIHITSHPTYPETYFNLIFLTSKLFYCTWLLNLHYAGGLLHWARVRTSATPANGTFWLRSTALRLPLPRLQTMKITIIFNSPVGWDPINSYYRARISLTSTCRVSFDCIQGVTGGTDQTSGGCSLSKVERFGR
jgi:hypothetical protein